MSNSHSESSDDSQENELNNKCEFFHSIIRKAIEETENDDDEMSESTNTNSDQMSESTDTNSDEQRTKSIYKAVVDKCKVLYKDMKDASEDDLWTAITEKAESFIETHDDLKINHDTAFDTGLKKYKCVIMQEIESILQEDSDDVEDADADDMEESDTIEDSVKTQINSQIGSGRYKYFTNRY